MCDLIYLYHYNNINFVLYIFLICIPIIHINIIEIMANISKSSTGT